MLVPALPFSLPHCAIDQISQTERSLRIEAHTTNSSACCPRCLQPSEQVHSRSVRTPRDLPVSEWNVTLAIRVRRFFCRQPSCPQHTFAERLPELVPFRARRTHRFTQRLRTLAEALGGEAGSRVADQSSLRTSPDTLLRLLGTTALTQRPTPRVLGVDDFAFHKGRSYGTLLVDLERRLPVELLPDRSAEGLAAWLQAHPGVEVVARDRSSEYARGATLGAPNALQVADRWHLLKNHREALERLLTRLAAELNRLPGVVSAPSLPPPRRLRIPSKTEQAAGQHSRQVRQERYDQVQALVQERLPVLQIAQRLGMSRATATKFAAAPSFPEHASHRRQASALDCYQPYLQQRWDAGCRNASQLWRELQAQGYSGVYRQVARWAAQQRMTLQAGTSTNRNEGQVEAARLASPRQLVWLLLRKESQLNPTEAATLARLQQHSILQQAHLLAQQFQAMVRQRKPEALDAWLATCAQSTIPELQTFARSLQQEYSSIRAALSEVWSTGQVEGQITRLKLIKRQMFGRASFDLLRKRVLAAEM